MVSAPITSFICRHVFEAVGGSNSSNREASWSGWLEAVGDALLSSTANTGSEAAGVSGREPGGESGSGCETGSEPGSETNGNGDAVTMELFAFLFSCFFLLLKSMKGSSSDSELEKKYMGSRAQVILILQGFFFCC